LIDANGVRPGLIESRRDGNGLTAYDASTMQTTMQQAVTSSNDRDPGTDTQLERELAALIVEALNLEVAPEDIAADAPLYGEGLGLDSIDILEVALVVSKKYGFQLRSDDENNVRIFQSLGSLAAHIATHRTK
jgi:acyl carrier protein